MFKENYKKIVNEINKLLLKTDQNLLEEISNEILIRKENKKNILIFGNGGSQAIASHISTDITNTLNIPSLSFSSNSLATCFSNDYSYELSISRFIEIFSSKDDLVILISSSGESENMINAAKICKSLKLKLVTLTGFNKDNRLNKYGDYRIHIPICHYNIVENAHQIILTTILDIVNKNII